MGLFDKIKDNARDISKRALEATREYDEDYDTQPAQRNTAEPTDTSKELSAPINSEQINSAKSYEEPVANNTEEAPEDDMEFLLGEKPEAPQIKEENIEVTTQVEPAEEAKAPVRTSRVVEMSKAEHEKVEAEKKHAKEQEKAKQAAKERLAKSYTPSYKQPKPEEKIEVRQETTEPVPPAKKPASAPRPATGIIDITPGKILDPLKQAIYARERAALSALASQRKLNGTVSLYVATHMNFKTRVFINRIEYSGSFGKNVLPIEQVAWIKVRHGGTGIIIETTEGKRVVMVVKQADRLAFVDAVMKVQAMQPKKNKLKDTQTVRIDKLEQFGEGIDEIEKLARLFDKGIISQEEFDAKKKQILGL